MILTTRGKLVSLLFVLGLTAFFFSISYKAEIEKGNSKLRNNNRRVGKLLSWKWFTAFHARQINYARAFHARQINYALGVTFSYLINFINELEMTLNLFPWTCRSIIMRRVELRWTGPHYVNKLLQLSEALVTPVFEISYITFIVLNWYLPEQGPVICLAQ